MGNPEFPLPRAGAAPGAVGCAVADAGRGAGADVAVEARRRADDGELRRPDGDRSRHRRVPVYDLPQSALVGDHGRACHIPLMYALWWLDPFRIRRLPALACKL